jgi:hypothetical protein
MEQEYDFSKGIRGKYLQPARAIFEEIRNRPYAWSSQIDKPANNCYFKGIELLQRLGALGYAVRGRVGETFLDTVIPEEIRLLYPTEFQLTHFWVEVLLNDIWHTLDASYDPGLASAGFNVNEWDSNRTCFEITKTYTQEEAIAYHDVWSDPEYARSYFKAVGPCAMALNEWYESLRKIDHKSAKKF